MIFNWLIGPLLSLVTAIMGVLPSGSFSIGTGGASAADTIGGYLAAINGYAPVSLYLDTLLIVVFFVMPAVMVYSIAQWCYKELPHIFGWGS